MNDDTALLLQRVRTTSVLAKEITEQTRQILVASRFQIDRWHAMRDTTKVHRAEKPSYKEFEMAPIKREKPVRTGLPVALRDSQIKMDAKNHLNPTLEEVLQNFLLVENLIDQQKALEDKERPN